MLGPNTLVLIEASPITRDLSLHVDTVSPRHLSHVRTSYSPGCCQPWKAVSKSVLGAPQACPQMAHGGASWTVVKVTTEGCLCARSKPSGPAHYMLFKKQGDSNPREQANVTFRY